MSARPLIPFALLLAFYACSHASSPTSPGGQAASSTYYVSTTGSDTGAGTLQQPFRTVKKGLSRLRPGDTLYLRGGTYNDIIEEVAFGTTGTSWSAFMTVSAYPGETVVLRPNFGPGNVLRIQDDTIHHVLVKNITLDGIFEGGLVGAAVLYCAPTCHDWHFDTVEVMNSDEQGILTGGTYMEFRNMHVHRNGATGPPYNAAEGVYATGSFTSFIGGEYENNECNAIRIWDSEHPGRRAHDNQISGITAHDNGYGHASLRNGVSTCYSGGGGFTIGDGPNNMVMSNVVYNGYWGSDDSFGHGDGNFYYDNTFRDNQYGVKLTADNTTFSRNSIYGNGENDLLNIGSGNTLADNLFARP